MIYTVTLNPAMDHILTLPEELAPGILNRAETEEVKIGGKGINVSLILKELGIESVAMGFIAGFTGTTLEHALKEQGIQTDFIRLPGGNTRTNIKVSGLNETEINGVGPNVTENELLKLIKKISKLQPGDILVLAGANARGLCDDTYARIMLATPKGVKIIVDGSGELLKQAVYCEPYLIKPNEEELRELIAPDGTVEWMARKAQEMGAHSVLVSLGGNGALLLDVDGVAHTCASPVGEVVSTVGAGDALLAGFIAGLMESDDQWEALKKGVAAGSATAFSVGMANKKTIDIAYDHMEE